MTRCNVSDERLHEYFDDQLPKHELHVMRDHIASCEACRKTLRELEILRLDAKSLRIGFEPERDLWPEIAVRLKERSSRARRRAHIRRFTGLTLAAATVCVAIAAGFQSMRTKAAQSLQEYANDAHADATLEGPSDIELQTVASAYGYTSRIVLAQFALPDASFASGARSALERNLAITDQALQELRTALAASPSNAHLRHRLLETYTKQAQLFEQAIALSEGVAGD